MNTLILGYGAAKWKLVPVSKDQKHGGSVLGKGWQLRASSEEQDLKVWFENTENWPAVLLGPESGIIDIEADSPEANAAAEQLLGSLGTLTYKSTRSTHRLFRWSQDLWEKLKKKSVVTTCKGIEVRMGGVHDDGKPKGCLSILPPAKNRIWQTDFSTELVKELPDEVIDELVEQAQKTSSAKTSSAIHGGRNNRLTEVVGRWASAEVYLGETTKKKLLQKALDLNCAFEPPLDHIEVVSVVNSVARMESDKREAAKQSALQKKKQAEREGVASQLIEDFGIKLVIIKSVPSTYRLYIDEILGDGVYLYVDTTANLLSFAHVHRTCLDLHRAVLPEVVFKKAWRVLIDNLVPSAEQVEASADEKEDVRFAYTVYECCTSPDMFIVTEDGRRVFQISRVHDRHPNISVQKVGSLLRECGFNNVRMMFGTSKRRVWVLDEEPLARLAKKAQV